MDGRRDGTDERPLHVLCYLHAADLGGVERSAARLCGAWTGAACVTLALGRGGPPRGLDGRVALRLAPRPPIPPSRWETLWMILWLPWVVLRERPDALFCAGNTYTVVAVAMKLVLGGRCPPVLAKISNALDRPDMSEPVRRLHGLWCRVQGRAIDAFVGMTPEMTREARAELRVPASRTTTIPTPLFDAAALATPSSGRERAEGRPALLLAVGRLEAQKNLLLLLEAFAAAPPDRLLAIVGEGGERPRLAAAISRMGLCDRVTLVGHSDDVPAWLRRADALVLSSDYEGVPAVVLEAMAAGLPVIATDCCASMAGLLADGRGVLVPRRDPAALAAAMAALPPPGHDPSAQRRFAGRHGVPSAAAAYLTLFRALAAPPAHVHFRQEHVCP